MPEEAIRLQSRLRGRLILTAPDHPPQTVAGADLAIDTEREEGVAGVIVYRYPGLQEIERRWARRPIAFPYIPGLLAFREIPVLLDAFDQLHTVPDVVLVDGQGIAHPRGLGIASHLGLWLGCATIGCAKSRLVGEHEEPALAAGSHTPLVLNGGVVGAVLRTRDRVQPIFVSPGHLIDLDGSIQVALGCCDGYRIPKPTREADHFVEEVKLGRLPRPVERQASFDF